MRHYVSHIYLLVSGYLDAHNKAMVSSCRLSFARDMYFEITGVHSPQALYGEQVSDVHDDLTLCLRRWLFDALCIVCSC
jgi:hypothetical protein